MYIFSQTHRSCMSPTATTLNFKLRWFLTKHGIKLKILSQVLI